MAEHNEKSPILPSYFKADMNDSTKARADRSRRKTYCQFAVVVIAVSLLAAIIVLVVVLAVILTRNNTESLVDSVKIDFLEQSLKELQDQSIDNSRSVLNGYNNSAEYIFGVLKDNGYEPVRQYFTVPVFDNLRPGEAVLRVQSGTAIDIYYIEYSQFNVMTYSGACDNCVGELTDKTDGSDSFGCDSGWQADDNVVLMAFDSTKGCSLYQKATRAKEAGAVGVIFTRDEGDTAGPPASRVYGVTDSGELTTVDIPAIGVSSAVGQQIKSFPPTVSITIQTYTTVTYAVTYNVLATSRQGSNDSIIVAGSHLDSVPAGPGINDNGSGSIANLQLAIELGKLDIDVKNQVLFAWWGAEELGLLGSTYYVAQLTDEEKASIALNLNYDMIASPNYQRGIYNGSSAEESINAASVTIQNTLIDFFNDNGLTYEIVPFTGRSDYGPFIEVEIPAGGLFTGAEVLKTEEQFNLFGGLVNAPLDPCYHQLCDNTNNINLEVYEQMTKAVAYAIETFATQDNLREYLENGGNK